MKPPIVVVTDDVDIFQTVTDAERYIEVPEVRKGIEASDSEALEVLIARAATYSA